MRSAVVVAVWLLAGCSALPALEDGYDPSKLTTPVSPCAVLNPGAKATEVHPAVLEYILRHPGTALNAMRHRVDSAWDDRVDQMVATSVPMLTEGIQTRGCVEIWNEDPAGSNLSLVVERELRTIRVGAMVFDFSDVPGAFDKSAELDLAAVRAGVTWFYAHDDGTFVRGRG